MENLCQDNFFSMQVFDVEKYPMMEGMIGKAW